MPLNQMDSPGSGDLTAVICTNHGDIKIRLFKDSAPKTVENFTTHAKNGYYNNLIFHRVINNFMIQGGDPTGTGTGGESIWDEDFGDEFDPYLHNIKGALSMANRGPGTNGSQFFIVQSNDIPTTLIPQMEELAERGFPPVITEYYKAVGGTPWLDFKHTVFGQVYEGMDIVDKIAALPVDSNDKPIDDVIINNVEISVTP